jgi:hypothetical protein
MTDTQITKNLININLMIILLLHSWVENNKENVIILRLKNI